MRPQAAPYQEQPRLSQPTYLYGSTAASYAPPSTTRVISAQVSQGMTSTMANATGQLHRMFSGASSYVPARQALQSSGQPWAPSHASPVSRYRSQDDPMPGAQLGDSVYVEAVRGGIMAGREAVQPSWRPGPGPGPVIARCAAPVAVPVERAETGGPPDTEFMRLLDSLEVRVDLMAQMQHTRNEIQARARSLHVPQSTYASSGHVEATPGLAPTEGGYRGAAGGAVHHAVDLSLENHELWGHYEEQKELIARLEEENDNFRRQLQGLGLEPGDGADELRFQLQALLSKARETDAEGQRLRELLHEERRERERAEQAFAMEREELWAEVDGLRALVDDASASGTPAIIPNAISSTGPPWGGGASSGVPTMPLLSAQAVQRGLEEYEAPPTAPFSRQTLGVNVSLSEDGYSATRTRGCRQSVIIGSAPLVQQAVGWYFEVEVCETVEGWVGGLGIGVTRSDPAHLRRVPDKAWRMPHTFVVGYWGCVFLDGQERRTKWRADNLTKGAKVGLLVSSDGSGDLRVFADGELVVVAAGALAEHAFPGVEFFPVVDVFAATLAVAMLPLSRPPPLPWKVAATAQLSPPGSPTGSMASMSRSMVSH